MWQPGCETSIDIQIYSRWYEMLGELANIPTGTLIDMLYVILGNEVTLTTSDVAEIEQIQRELQRRGEAQNWILRNVN
jgi:chemotaxis protein CheY-P-specific phosphatase CheC